MDKSTKKPPRLIIYGEEKVGKSTFFAGAPNPIFTRTEDGLNSIDTAGAGISKHAKSDVTIKRK